MDLVSVLPEQVERVRCWRAENGQSVPKKTVRNLSTNYNPGTFYLSIYTKKSVHDGNISLKDFSSIDSSIQSNSTQPTSSSKTIHFQLVMIVCIESEHLKISKLK